MTDIEFVPVRPGTRTLSLADVSTVAEHLLRGGVAVLPTETGYMVAARADSIPAIEQVFRAKNRDPANVMHVACSSLDMAQRIGELSEPARRVIGHFTPGPVTTVVPKTPLLPDTHVTLNGTVGIRVPDSAATLQVISAVGVPLTATSLNEAGGEVLDVTEQSLKTLAWPEDDVVLVVVDADSHSLGQASTLVLIEPGQLRILRPGPIDEAELSKVANGI